MNLRLVVSVIALGCSVAPGGVAAQVEDGDSIIVATYNICYGNIDVPLMADTIRKCGADVVCLQETTARSERYLRQHLRSEYPAMHFRGHGGPFLAERFGVLAKRQLTELKYHPPAGRYFGFLTFDYPTNTTPVSVTNVHLAPFTLGRPRSAGDVMRQLSATEVEHAREIDVILDRVDADRPAIVVGDFNSLSGFHAPRTLQEAGFIDSFASVTRHADTVPTWKWPLHIGEVKFRIDYIFHTRHYSTVRSGVDQAVASDHRLLWSELRPSGDVPDAGHVDEMR